ncbi:MAG TPA: ATP synthase F0 subunit B [Trichocoleus sp.]
MLRQDPDRLSPDRRKPNPNQNGGSANRPNNASQGEGVRLGNIDIQRELNKLEEMILDSPRIPLSRRTLIDEEQFLDQLDLVRLNLPGAFQEATDLILHKEDLLLDAEQYAQEIVAAAEQRAAQILDEIGIIRQAEIEAQRIRQQVQQECEAMQDQTIADIEQLRRRAQQELEDMQRMALAECQEIQRGADDYADRVLREMEQQLNEMMRVVRNGRQQLGNSSASRNEPTPYDNYPNQRY